MCYLMTGPGIALSHTVTHKFISRIIKPELLKNRRIQ